ncbi:unnamed protein product [Boreogadus saida]
MNRKMNCLCQTAHRFCFSFNKCSLSWETRLTASEEPFCHHSLLLEVYSGVNCAERNATAKQGEEEVRSRQKQPLSSVF